MNKFNQEIAALKQNLTIMQGSLDSVVNSSEELTNGSLPIKFFNRVCVGELTKNFNDLAKSVFEYEAQLNQVLAKEKVAKAAEEQAVLTKVLSEAVPAKEEV